MANSELGVSVRMERMRLGDLRLAEVNARFMRHETFQALVANIARDGCLTQAPFAIREADGVYLVLSGNHRVQAGIEALGPDHVDNIMVTDDELSPEQRVAIQLSHNAIVGEDDPTTLKQLYEQLGDIELKDYSGLDDKALDLLLSSDTPPLSEANLEFQPITLMFLPDEVERVQAAFESAMTLLPKQATWLARMSEYDRTLDAMDAAATAYDVRNVATSLLLVLDVFEAHIGDLRDGYEGEDAPKHRGWVPVSVALGSFTLPPDVAMLVGRAVSRMVDAGEVPDKARWKALEYWAADYLAS
ncbi:MAG TPA: ParB N-terminal domain-containing protein [Actinomycetes bacterium]|nr:ParB N-terminal domain-containing protein [Actinomycetes bacterium]